MRIWITSMFILLALSVSAQDSEAPFPSIVPHEKAPGGFGGPMFSFGRVNSDWAYLAGGVNGMYITEKAGLMLRFAFQKSPDPDDRFRYFAAGPFLHFRKDKVLNFMLSGTWGGGGITTTANDQVLASPMIVLNGEAAAQLRIFPHAHLRIGVAYRHSIITEDIPGVKNIDYSGPVFSFGLVMGISDVSNYESWLSRYKKHLTVSGEYAFRISNFKEQTAWMEGIGFRFILDRKWAMGVHAYRSRNTITHKGVPLNTDYFATSIQYLFSRLGRLHPYLEFQSGFGAISVADPDTFADASSTFGVLEPGVGVNVQILPYMRFSAGMGYRIGIGSFKGMDSGDFSSLSGFLALQFAGF